MSSKMIRSLKLRLYYTGINMSFSNGQTNLTVTTAVIRMEVKLKLEVESSLPKRRKRKGLLPKSDVN